MRLSLLKNKNNDLKKRLAKNNEDKMVIYNALPRKEYERIFMCNTTKEIWKTLLITHQGNCQVKDNKIDLLVQQYEQFVISEDESINSAFARFNTIITSQKALDEGYSSKNYVRKFLRALHPKWRAKVMAIEESKDLTSLSLDELIGNLKVYEIITKKDSKIVKAKRERGCLALKAKKESSDEESLTFKSEDEEYAMAVRDFKKFFKRRGRDPNHLIRECPKPPKDKNQRDFVGGSWSDSGIATPSGEEHVEKATDETYLMAQASSEVHSESSYFSDENSSIDEIVLDSQICDNKCKAIFSKHDCEITKDEKVIAHASHKAKNIVSTTRCLELLHMDIFGPSAVRSYGGDLYTIVIVDDYSREFDNEVQFGEFCNANDITHNFSAPRTLQSNGVGSVFMAMTSDHNRSELGIQDHSNEQTSSKLVPKVVPLAVKTTTSRQEMGLLFHLHIAMLRTTGNLEESLNVTFNETPPPSKTSPLVDDDLDEDQGN
ncbi:retrovirus-related pol polyprotein from transposon TNT 1-94 [Tanacetum coccineum]